MGKNTHCDGRILKVENIKAPRIVIAGTSSGSGKTTITCAILEILKRNGFSPVAFKCGPDYLDTMFHTAVIGVESANLDPFFLDGNGLRGVLCSHMGSHSLAVVEGVMGYYDGTGENGMENSTFSVAEGTGSPVILVVSGKGAFTSILAQIEGFLHFVPESRIKGVIINQISKGSYTKIASLIARRFGEDIKPIGFLEASSVCVRNI